MPLSYAKRNKDAHVDIERLINVKDDEREKIPEKVDTFFVDTKYMVKDDQENIWIYSPMEDKYYLYYIKKEDVHTMICYPTITSTISPECKLGLNLYREPRVSSPVIERIQNKHIQVTSKFKEDSDGNIWVYCVNFDVPSRPKEVTDGWVIYKNKRNNFLNLIIAGDKSVVTKNGILDPELVKEFSNYLFFLDTSYEYQFGDNWLQFFAVKKPNSNSVNVKPATITKYYAYVGTRKKSNIWKNVNDNNKNDDFGKRHLPYPLKIHGVKKGTPYPTRSWHAANNAKRLYATPFGFPDKLDKRPGELQEYNYEMVYDGKGDNIYDGQNFDDIDDKKLKRDMRQLYQDINFDIRSEKEMYERNFTRYNRFKLAYPDDYLSRGFAHVFFTRPDCALIKDDRKNLRKKVERNPNFAYAWAHRDKLIRNLTLTGTKMDHDWNLFLSNKAEEFSLSDESIKTDTYGDTFLKQKIAYGQGSHESRTAGEFSVKYHDNRWLDIYHYHKLWTDYINNVYTGSWYPKKKYLWGKILDYAVCAYYILTAEDGETILFWSKYYGVFPTNTPSSAYSWSTGQAISSPEVNITYQYSLKEDFNPTALIEFNLNTHMDEDTDSMTYEPVFNHHLGSSGVTWVGAPFIETVENKNSKDYMFKLRFKHMKSTDIVLAK